MLPNRSTAPASDAQPSRHVDASVSLPPVLPDSPSTSEHPRRIPAVSPRCSVISACLEAVTVAPPPLPAHVIDADPPPTPSPLRPVATAASPGVGSCRTAQPRCDTLDADVHALPSRVLGRRGRLGSLAAAHTVLEHLHRGAQIRDLSDQALASPTDTDPPPRASSPRPPRRRHRRQAFLRSRTPPRLPLAVQAPPPPPPTHRDTPNPTLPDRRQRLGFLRRGRIRVRIRTPAPPRHHHHQSDATPPFHTPHPHHHTSHPHPLTRHHPLHRTSTTR